MVSLIQEGMNDRREVLSKKIKTELRDTNNKGHKMQIIRRDKETSTRK